MSPKVNGTLWSAKQATLQSYAFAVIGWVKAAIFNKV